MTTISPRTNHGIYIYICTALLDLHAVMETGDACNNNNNNNPQRPNYYCYYYCYTSKWKCPQIQLLYNNDFRWIVPQTKRIYIRLYIYIYANCWLLGVWRRGETMIGKLRCAWYCHTAGFVTKRVEFNEPILCAIHNSSLLDKLTRTLFSWMNR